MSSATQQLDKAEVESKLVALNDEYQDALKELGESEDNVRKLENSSFQLLQKLYKQFKTTDPSVRSVLASLENKYNDSLQNLELAKQVSFEKQSASFKLLQRLNLDNRNYLVGIINGLQAQNKELIESLEQLKIGNKTDSVGKPIAKKIESVNQESGRANNLSA